MGHPFEIDFPPLAERERRAVTVARVLTPIDRFTGRIVSSGIEAAVPAERAIARRSLRGHLIFDRLGGTGPHVVAISTAGTGYFGIGPLTLPVPQDFGDDAQRLVRLDLRPEAVADGSAAILRGAVRRRGMWIAGARIVGGFEREETPFETRVETLFETRTSPQGAFALRLRPPPVSQTGGVVDVPFRAKVSIRVEFDGFDHPVAEQPVVRDMETTRLARIVEFPDS